MDTLQIASYTNTHRSLTGAEIVISPGSLGPGTFEAVAIVPEPLDRVDKVGWTDARESHWRKEVETRARLWVAELDLTGADPLEAAVLVFDPGRDQVEEVDVLEQRSATTMVTEVRLTEQDVQDVRFALRHPDEAEAREALDHLEGEAEYDAAFAEYRRGKELASTYRLITTRRKDATLDAYAEIEALSARHTIVSPWVRFFAGYVAQNEHAVWVALAAH